MSKFSQRYGYTALERAFQRERVDDTLRTSLWNVLSICMWDRWKPDDYPYTPSDSRTINNIASRLWFHYFKRDMDNLPVFKAGYRENSAYEVFKEYFSGCKWYDVYNFLEALLQDKETFLDAKSIEWLNDVLETENAAYRIVGTEVVEITDTNEIKAIEEALGHPDAPVRTHIQSALAMLSDRAAPDYRNAIKEAI
jgi:hypothetical protein